MGHYAVSATKASSLTLLIWQYGARENCFNFPSFNRVVDTKTSIIPMGSNIVNVGWKYI